MTNKPNSISNDNTQLETIRHLTFDRAIFMQDGIPACRALQSGYPLRIMTADEKLSTGYAVTS